MVTAWPPETQPSCPCSRRKEKARDKSVLLWKSSYISLTWWLWPQSHRPPLAERAVRKCNLADWHRRVRLAMVTNRPLNVVASHDRPLFFSHRRKRKLSFVASRPPTWGLRLRLPAPVAIPSSRTWIFSLSGHMVSKNGESCLGGVSGPTCKAHIIGLCSIGQSSVTWRATYPWKTDTQHLALCLWWEGNGLAEWPATGQSAAPVLPRFCS